MKKTLIYGTSIATLMFALASCGGSEEESTDDTTDNTETVEDAIEAVEYTVDTESSTINWWNMNEGEKGHYGTAKVMEGSFTVEGDVVTGASLTMDMNSVTADDAMGEKLLGHLSSPDFLDLNQYATSTFTFDSHEEGTIYGTLNVAGLEMAVEAPATVADGSVEISDFNIDMAQFPFFTTEQAEKPEAEWHDTSISFNASIVGM